MRIGFIGNVNNYPYQIAQKIRELEHEVVFIITDEISNKLYRPEFFDEKVNHPYPEWIKEIELKKLNYHKRLYFPKKGYKPYLDLLNECDGVVTNDFFGHEIASLINDHIPVINLFSGSDLDVYAVENFEDLDRKIANPKLKFAQPLKDFFLRKRKKRYRQGISKSVGISYYPIDTNPIGDSLLIELKKTPYDRFERWNSIVLDLPYHSQPNNSPLKLFSAVRFLWKKPLPHGYNIWEDKGNDIMLKGIAMFRRQNPELSFELHLVEKGDHIEETKELIESLQLEDLVFWHKEMSLIDINEFYKNSDIILEQFGNHIMGGAGVFPMIMGRPVICNGRKDILERIIPDKVPYCYATNEEEIVKWLEKLYDSPILREEIGKKTRDYMFKNDGLPKEARFVINTFEKYLNSQKLDVRN